LKGPNSGGVNNGRIARAIARLIEHGFLAEPTPGSWMERRAREYRLTFVSSGKAPPFRSATNEYLSWSPNCTRNVSKRASPRRDQTGDLASPNRPAASDVASPVMEENGRFPCGGGGAPGDGEASLIEKPYRVAS
jgi:hypothetical protein